MSGTKCWKCYSSFDTWTVRMDMCEPDLFSWSVGQFVVDKFVQGVKQEILTYDLDQCVDDFLFQYHPFVSRGCKILIKRSESIIAILDSSEELMAWHTLNRATIKNEQLVKVGFKVFRWLV